MGYKSYCLGFVQPRDLEELLKALLARGFTIAAKGRIYAEGGEIPEDLAAAADGGLVHTKDDEFTGFVVDNDEGMLVGYDEAAKTYGFTDFVKALQEPEISRLLALASIGREGQDHDDTEGYEYDGSRWYVSVSVDYLVPIDRTSQALNRLEALRAELKNLA